MNKIFTNLHKIIDYSLGSLKGNTVNAYWYSKIPNFGDLLNPILLRKYRLTPLSSPPNLADVVALGSSLQIVPENFSGFIIGAGLIKDMTRKFPFAKILALRGQLTRDRIGIVEKIPLGDPGLLIPLVFPINFEKKYILGLVPHHVDKQDDRLKEICRRYPKDVHFIDVQGQPKKVISEICQCEYILSSSLHGLVTADALEIPNAWVLLSNNVIGNGFKFHDYASAFNSNIEPNLITGQENLSEIIKLTDKRVGNLQEIQSNLDSAFRLLQNEIRNK